MRRTAVTVIALASCAPKVDRGPIPVERAQQPPQVIEVADPAAVSVWLEARVHAGSAFDPTGREGLAALTARSLIEGGAGDNSSAELQAELSAADATIEVEPEKEWVSLRMQCPREQGSTCVGLFADILVRPGFADDGLTRARERAVRSLTVDLSGNPDRLGQLAFDALLYEAHPYGHPVDGRAGIVPLLRGEEVRGFFTTHYVREAVTAGIAGGFDPALAEDLRARLAALPGTLPPELPLFQPEVEKGRRMVILDDLSEGTRLYLGDPWALPRNDPDFPALLVAFAALGGGPGDRLTREFSEMRHLSTQDTAAAEPGAGRPGAGRVQPDWSVAIGPMSDQNAAFGVRLAVSALERFAREGLTAEELESAKSRLTTTLDAARSDPRARMAFALDAASMGGPDLLETLPPALAGLTLESVNSTLQRRLSLTGLELVAVTDRPTELRDALVGAEPTPMVPPTPPDAPNDAVDREVATFQLGLAADRVTVTPANDLFR